ncbi:MAG: hypothetical protein RR335_06945 [Eubacterium sp.]
MKTNTDVTIVRTGQAGLIETFIIEKVNWQEQFGIDISGKTIRSVKDISVYIPCESIGTKTPQKGDRIIKGKVLISEKGGKELQKTLQSNNASTIMNITNNLHLGAKLGHIELGCE